MDTHDVRIARALHPQYTDARLAAAHDRINAAEKERNWRRLAPHEYDDESYSATGDLDTIVDVRMWIASLPERLQPYAYALMHDGNTSQLAPHATAVRRTHELIALACEHWRGLDRPPGAKRAKAFRHR